VAAQSDDQTVGARYADRRRAAHRQALDGVPDHFGALLPLLDDLAGKPRLIEKKELAALPAQAAFQTVSADRSAIVHRFPPRIAAILLDASAF
jgi:hypothetical protein